MKIMITSNIIIKKCQIKLDVRQMHSVAIIFHECLLCERLLFS